MKPLTVALTGATGFLGDHTLRRLAEAGHSLRVLMRGGHALDVGPNPVTVVPGDLHDQSALAKLVEGADLIFHLAGAIKAPNRDAFMRTNRDGTKAMVTAWQTHAPKADFVLVSSLAARHPQLSHYAASKAAAEDAVMGTAATVFRPTAIYGPKDKETLRLFQAARLPIQVSLNSADAKLTFIHVSDVVDALIVATQQPDDIRGKVFELCDSNLDGYSWAQMIAAATACWGQRTRVVRLPAWILRLGGRFGDLQASFGKAPMLTSQKCREILFADWSIAYPDAPPQQIWAPRTGIDTGFKQTFDWYREAGWL